MTYKIECSYFDGTRMVDGTQFNAGAVILDAALGRVYRTRHDAQEAAAGIREWVASVSGLPRGIEIRVVEEVPSERIERLSANAVPF